MTKVEVALTGSGLALAALIACSAAVPLTAEKKAERPRRLNDVLVFLRPAWYRHASLDSVGHCLLTLSRLHPRQDSEERAQP